MALPVILVLVDIPGLQDLAVHQALLVLVVPQENQDSLEQVVHQVLVGHHEHLDLAGQAEHLDSLGLVEHQDSPVPQDKVVLQLLVILAHLELQDLVVHPAHQDIVELVEHQDLAVLQEH